MKSHVWKEQVMEGPKFRFLILVLCGALIPFAAIGQQPSAKMTVTFTKDVAPIFQEKCEACHRPDSMAPMSLISYEEARPWAQAIKARVAKREMPPWHIDK